MHYCTSSPPGRPAIMRSHRHRPPPKPVVGIPSRRNLNSGQRSIVRPPRLGRLSFLHLPGGRWLPPSRRRRHVPFPLPSRFPSPLPYRHRKGKTRRGGWAGKMPRGRPPSCGISSAFLPIRHGMDVLPCIPRRPRPNRWKPRRRWSRTMVGMVKRTPHESAEGERRIINGPGRRLLSRLTRHCRLRLFLLPLPLPLRLHGVANWYFIRLNFSICLRPCLIHFNPIFC